MKISTSKTKVVALKGHKPIRSKLAINNQPTKQVKNFQYLGCDISYDGKTDIDKNLNKFLRVTGAINGVLLRRKICADTRIKVYNVLALPVLMYGSEVWVLRGDTKIRITAAEVKFLRRTAGYIRMDCKRNEDILKELEAEPILERIKMYRKN